MGNLLHISENPKFLGMQMLALPLGVEPRSSVPETNVLSIELQERMLDI
jgi:hypothetical protein